MSRYRVIVTRPAVERCWVDIDAESAAGAKRAAQLLGIGHDEWCGYEVEVDYDAPAMWEVSGDDDDDEESEDC